MNNITSKDLELLVNSGCIIGYSYSNQEYEAGSGSRETEQLYLYFPNGITLKIDTFCSGCSENTCLLLEAKSSAEVV